MATPRTAAEPQAAWDNPAWVLTVMHFPNEPVLLDHVSSGSETMPGDAAWHRRRLEAAQRGSTAGDVLAMLYAMDQPQWQLTTEPSISKAVAIVEKMHQQSDHWRRVPKGKTEIYARIVAYRRVWHLWAAWRLIRDEPDRPKVAAFSDELPDLLAMGRTVQDWARVWRPKRVDRLTALASALLDTDAYLVPPGVQLQPRWGEHPLPWVVEAMKKYKPRNRT